MEKYLSYIKKNYGYILLIFFIVLTLYIHNFIYLYGDDFIYGSYLKGNVSEFFNKHINHYMFKNGRALVHFIVTLVLLTDTVFWKIINPISIGVLIILISKIISKNRETFNKSIVIVIMLVSLIGINISREAIFWLDGSFNYLYPMILMLLNTYLSMRLVEKNSGYYWLPIIGFFTGATVEQAGMMSIGSLFLIIVNEVFVKKKRISKIIYINFLTTIMGYLTVVLAPGNFNRISKIKASIFDNIIHLLNYNFISDEISIFILFLMLSAILILIKLIKDKVLIKLNKILLIIMSFNLGVYAILTCFTKQISTLGNNIFDKNIIITSSLAELTGRLDGTNLFGVILWVVTIAICVFSVCVTCYISILKYSYYKDIKFISFTILAIGAQLMMVISPVIGFRTIFPSLIAWFIVIGIAFIDNVDKKYTIALILLITSIYLKSSIVIVLSIVAMILLGNKNLNTKKIVQYYIILILSIISIYSLSDEIKGYKENKIIHEYNLNKIKNFKINYKDDNLVLRKAKNDKYRYTMIYESEPHVDAFKTYYGIPVDINIIFK